MGPCRSENWQGFYRGTPSQCRLAMSGNVTISHWAIRSVVPTSVETPIPLEAPMRSGGAAAVAAGTGGVLDETDLGAVLDAFVVLYANQDNIRSILYQV